MEINELHFVLISTTVKLWLYRLTNKASDEINIIWLDITHVQFNML